MEVLARPIRTTRYNIVNKELLLFNGIILILNIKFRSESQNLSKMAVQQSNEYTPLIFTVGVYSDSTFLIASFQRDVL